jgi:polar amino acid transport system ATP-binding protein
MNFARNVADRVIYMKDGRVHENGPASILDKPGTPALAAFIGATL